MSGRVNHRILLASRPVGEPTLDDFSLVGEAVPTPGPGQLLLRTIHLSLDPHMRGRMNAAKSYAAPVEVGEVMVGGTVCEIVASNAAVSDFADQHQQFVAEVGAWVRAGTIRYREDFVDGIAGALRAFIGMLRGENFGKVVVRVGSEDATR